MYVQAVRYSGNMSWAAEMLPFVQTMASYVLAKRAAAEEAYPAGHPFHGIVSGSPEHDICTAPSFFFSLNVWFVRGLTSLAQLHREYPSLTRTRHPGGRAAARGRRMARGRSVRGQLHGGAP